MGGWSGEWSGGVGVKGGVGGKGFDRGVSVLACQSITGFFRSRYGMPRISDCAPSGATKKAPE